MGKALCKYAGLTDDEECEFCNGISYELDGQEIPAYKCPGYEAGDDVAEDDVEEATEPEPQEAEPEPEPDKPKPKKEVAKKVVKQATENEKEEKATAPKKVAKKPQKPTINNSEGVKKDESDDDYEITTEDLSKLGVNVKTLCYKSSATIQKGDNYYKFSAQEEWDVSDAKDKDLALISEMLWTRLNSEVDKQVKEILDL